jgi:surface protein
MFYTAKAFNQPLDKWDVSKVTDMSIMFQDVTNFDTDISVWDLSGIDSKMNNVHSMFKDSGYKHDKPKPKLK